MESAAQRKQQQGLTEDTFERLLEWLDPDRERAGHKYEVIRLRLIKIFICRGCSAPEDLADATVDRVAAKMGELAGRYVGEPALYFYNVADKIYLEHGRKERLYFPLSDNLAEVDKPAPGAQVENCFEHCMESLPERSRELILAYYGYERLGKDKLDHRKALAERLGMADHALWIRIHRIREALKKCVQNRMRGAQARASKKDNESSTKQER
jgi:DNA-directed RNA polymerase specialized sigma24 family protein